MAAKPAIWSYKDPARDGRELRKKYSHPEKGANVYFRTMCISAQSRFIELFPCKQAPRVFLHGNPHIDNFARIGRRTGMIDFDRSRIGPYAWDLTRFIGSILLRCNELEDSKSLATMLRALKDGYLEGVNSYQTDFKHCSILDHVKQKRWQKSLLAYLESNKKWAKKLNANLSENISENTLDILNGYLASRHETRVLEHYQVKKLAKVHGSLGHPHYLFLLEQKNAANGHVMFIDIKETYCDKDNGFFFNPYKHHGIRMIEASRLYAPGMEEGLGYASFGNKNYWGRHIPCFKAKVKGSISLSHCIELAECIGHQLGLAHGKSLHYTNRNILLIRFLDDFKLISELAYQINREIAQGYEYYLNELATLKDNRSRREEQVLM